MMLSESAGRGLMRRFTRLDLDRVAEAALAAQAEAIAAAAGEAGAADGEVQAAATEVVIGWRSPSLRRRESGIAGVAPAPVLAPVAAALAEAAAPAVGTAVAAALRGY